MVCTVYFAIRNLELPVVSYVDKKFAYIWPRSFSDIHRIDCKLDYNSASSHSSKIYLGTSTCTSCHLQICPRHSIFVLVSTASGPGNSMLVSTQVSAQLGPLLYHWHAVPFRSNSLSEPSLRLGSSWDSWTVTDACQLAASSRLLRDKRLSHGTTLQSCKFPNYFMEKRFTKNLWCSYYPQNSSVLS